MASAAKKRRLEGVEETAMAENFIPTIESAYKINSLQLGMKVGALYFPKLDYSNPKGDDAYFVHEEKQTIGVADGVGGWAKLGVDAGIYARKLMNNCVIALDYEVKGDVDPRRVLQEAFLSTKAEGSSTVCVISLRDDNCLHVVNVGDSGFMLFRNNQCVYRSPLQQHRFNFPYQLGNNENSDRPSDALEIKVFVEPGDIVVAFTDGLLDNVYPEEIEEILMRETKGGVCPQKLAFTIATAALENSLDERSCSPFAKAASLAGCKYVGEAKIVKIHRRLQVNRARKHISNVSYPLITYPKDLTEGRDVSYKVSKRNRLL
ncbi:protein phosphatase 2C 55 [Tripterygium wilfordii]|uniref:Protein phosphatase n=1 Tax=Tripterygium wilfordii TaxID=458696 RepID=A0A7J7DR42_TRIWF|nr:probable protein phosphatase 2C 55 [Tripterygium wilfordii]KAF5748576.1 protein phosphatase 2C 55 [Tripterygium wilfordii]